jgi:hypothetical protein
VKAMSSGRRKQDQKAYFTLVAIELSLDLSDVRRIFPSAAELISGNTGKGENECGHDTDLYVVSLDHTSSTAARSACLRRTRDRAVGAKNTAIADERFVKSGTILALPKKDAGISRHIFRLLKAAGRTR